LKKTAKPDEQAVANAEIADALKLFEQRLSMLVDRAAVTANDIAGKAVSRVIAERDQFMQTTSTVREAGRTAASMVEQNRKKLDALNTESAQLKQQMGELTDAVAHYRSLVGLLTDETKDVQEVIGKVVELKSGGGVRMTVGGTDHTGAILCFWSVEGDPEIYERGIPLAALKIVGEPA
jgi:chromosome segregation ATPase